MRALEFITGHVIYNPAYTYKFQLKTTPDTGSLSWRNSILSKLKDPIIIDPKLWY